MINVVFFKQATAFVLQDHAYCCIEESHSPVYVLEVAPLPVDVLQVCVEDNMTVDMTANDNKVSPLCKINFFYTLKFTKKYLCLPLSSFQ